jgi:PmbA protein
LNQEELFSYIIDEYKKKKIPDVEIFNQRVQNFSAEVRMSQLENIENSISKGLGIRIFKEGKTAFVCSSDFNKDSIKTLIDISVENLKESDQSEFNQLAPFTKAENKDLDIYHPEAFSIDKQIKIDRIKKLEAFTLDDPSINNSNGASYSESEGMVQIINTNGANLKEKLTSYSMSVSPIASSNNQMETNFWYSAARNYDDLKNEKVIADIAIERTKRQLDAEKPISGKYSLVFENNIASSFLAIFFSSINGLSVFKKESFMHDKLNKQIFPEFISVIEDPFIVKGVGSQNYDSEGIPSQYKEIIKNGTLTTFIHNYYSALKNKVKSTGNASRSYASKPGISSTNLFIENQQNSRMDLLNKNEKTILITGIIGQNINSLTGDFSMGASGLLYQNGNLINSVKEFTIAGNLLELYNKIEALADDRLVDKSISMPSFLVNEISVSGK